LETFVTSQFCTGGKFNTPQSESANRIINKKNEILCLVFLYKIPHANAHASNRIIKRTWEYDRIKMNKTANTAQNSSVSKNHFDMFKSLRRANY
jgi:hypothetical protein